MQDFMTYKKNHDHNYTQVTYWKRFIQGVKDYREIIGLITTLFTVAGLLITYLISANINPLSEDIDLLKTSVYANTAEHNSMVRHEEFDQVIVRLDKISGRVDLLISKLIK